jgi:hypothetical protein
VLLSEVELVAHAIEDDEVAVGTKADGPDDGVIRPLLLRVRRVNQDVDVETLWGRVPRQLAKPLALEPGGVVTLRVQEHLRVIGVNPLLQPLLGERLSGHEDWLAQLGSVVRRRIATHIDGLAHHQLSVEVRVVVARANHAEVTAHGADVV